MIPDGFIFGLLDNGIVLLGMYLGLDFESWLAKKLGKTPNPSLGAIVGALGSNTISDAFAAWFDPGMQPMIYGIVLGCLLPLLFVPFIEKYKK